jgi:hypothetical protein
MTPGFVFNNIFSCCSFSSPTASDSSNSTAPTLITSADLSHHASLIDQGQQQIELSISYYTSDAPSSSSSEAPETFRVVVRFLDASGNYLIIDPNSEATAKELNTGDAESLLYYSFDAITPEPTRVPVGARGVVLQILVPLTRTSFCFDYFALRICKFPILFV